MIGKFKDEMGDQVMSHFCANRSKSYSYKLDGEEVHNVLKGIVKAVRNKMINFEDYRRCVFDQKIKGIKQTRFEVKNHIMKTVITKKVALKPSDNNRVVLEDGVNTIAYGHFNVISAK